MKIYVFSYEFSIGKLWICTDETSLLEISFTENLKTKHAIYKETDLIKIVKNQLVEYFDGRRKEFEIPISLKGTDFQLKVWKELCKIPYGKTCTYKDIAVSIKNKNACRAVGLANNKNPIPIIIPCHRVIGKNGQLTGYAGGLDIKKKLLNIERL